ncbi:MAG: diacylglycerol/lipid kinase family protein [Clostridium fessum]
MTLGYIPVGTGSDLARGLRLSRRPMRGLRRIFKARRIRQIDYGVIAYGDDVLRHRRFIVSAGIGLDAEVCQHMQRSAIKNICNRIHLRRLSYRILGCYTVFEGETDPGVYFAFDGTRRVEFNYIYFISAQIQPCEGGGFWFAPKADSSDGNLWRSALSAMPRSGRCLEPCSGRCSGAPTTGGFGASAAGRSRSTRNARWQFTWTARLSVPEQSGSPLY